MAPSSEPVMPKKNNYNPKRLERHLKYLDEKIEGYLQELDDHDQIESPDRKPDAKEIEERIENKGTVLCLTIPHWHYKLSVGELICQG